MRWLVVAALGACSFSPGKLGGDAGQSDDVRVVTDANDLDAPGDMMIVAPAKVRSIDVTDALVSGGPHTSFPLLVSISATWLRSKANAGDVARDDAFDLYFASDVAGTTRLSHEIEVYTPTTGDLVAWVKVPSLTPTTVIYLHYGDPANTTDPQAVANVWTAGYELVAHMDGSGDATGKSTTATSTGLTAATGKVGPAQAFDGSTSVADFGSDTALDNLWDGGGTAEGWVFADTYGEAGFGRVFSKAWILFVVSDSTTGVTNSMSFYYSDGQWFAPSNSLSLGSWHHVSVRYDPSALTNKPIFFVDGVLVATVDYAQPTAALDDDLASTLVGDRPTRFRAFDGSLDELRLSSVVRGDAWLLTQYLNQAAPAAFYTVSAPL